MAFYMFLFTFAMVLFLTDARPFHKISSGIKDYNNMVDYDIYDGNNRVFDEQENRERRLRSLIQFPDFFFLEYQQRHFRHHNTDMNEYNKRNIKLNDYYPFQYVIENDHDYNGLL